MFQSRNQQLPVLFTQSFCPKKMAQFLTKYRGLYEKHKFILFQLGATLVEFKKMRIDVIEMNSKPRKNGIISSFLSNFYK